MTAFNVVKYEPRFSSFYNRLIANGKTKMQAYVAVQKKLLVLIYALWKKDEAFHSQRAPATCREKTAAMTTSSNEELKLLLPGVFKENQKQTTMLKKAAPTSRAAQDELPCNVSLEVLLPVEQR